MWFDCCTREVVVTVNVCHGSRQRNRDLEIFNNVLDHQKKLRIRAGADGLCNVPRGFYPHSFSIYPCQTHCCLPGSSWMIPSHFIFQQIQLSTEWGCWLVSIVVQSFSHNCGATVTSIQQTLRCCHSSTSWTLFMVKPGLTWIFSAHTDFSESGVPGQNQSVSEGAALPCNMLPGVKLDKDKVEITFCSPPLLSLCVPHGSLPFSPKHPNHCIIWSQLCKKTECCENSTVALTDTWKQVITWELRLKHFRAPS